MMIDSPWLYFHFFFCWIVCSGCLRSPELLSDFCCRHLEQIGKKSELYSLEADSGKNSNPPPQEKLEGEFWTLMLICSVLFLILGTVKVSFPYSDWFKKKKGFLFQVLGRIFFVGEYIWVAAYVSPLSRAFWSHGKVWSVNWISA